MNTRKTKKKTADSLLVGYAGDGRLVSRDKARRIAAYVIGNYWRHPGRPPGDFVLDINIVSAAEIKRINSKYLGRDCATDVIAFNFMEGQDQVAGERPFLGQVIISGDAVSSQARELGHSRRDEMKILMIHGLLHIAGFGEGEDIQVCQTEIKKQLDLIL